MKSFKLEYEIVTITRAIIKKKIAPVIINIQVIATAQFFL